MYITHCFVRCEQKKNILQYLVLYTLTSTLFRFVEKDLNEDVRVWCSNTIN